LTDAERAERVGMLLDDPIDLVETDGVYSAEVGE
jgi:hypothetical protein